MRNAITAAFGSLLALLGLTWWSLESSEVAVLHSRRADGSIRSTHVWHVSSGGELWVEAGTPENGWFQDVQHSPEVALTIDGRRSDYLAEPRRDPGSHARIRSLLRRKYGYRDRWVGLLVDSSRSIAVRMHPRGGSGAPRPPPDGTR